MLGREHLVEMLDASALDPAKLVDRAALRGRFAEAHGKHVAHHLQPQVWVQRQSRLVQEPVGSRPSGLACRVEPDARLADPDQQGAGARCQSDGGTVSFGYRVEDRKLVIFEEEAAIVRMIFALYRELGAIPATVAELERRGIVTRVRPLTTGQPIGGIPFRSGSLQALLRNRAYVGELFHKGDYHPGEHPPILDSALFTEVQAMLDRQRSGRTRSAHRMAALLLGKVEDSRGHSMVPTHTNKKNIIYRYYQSRALIDGRKAEAGDPSRVPAHALEQRVIMSLRDWLASHASSNPLNAAQLHQTGLLDPDRTDATLIERLLARVTVHREAITLLIREPNTAADRAGGGEHLSR